MGVGGLVGRGQQENVFFQKKEKKDWHTTSSFSIELMEETKRVWFFGRDWGLWFGWAHLQGIVWKENRACGRL